VKVLIADDHKLLAEAVGSMLTAQGGFDVVTVENYHQALAQLDQDPDFDIVLLDLKMPGMVGLDSVRSIVEKARSGKVVLFTGLVDRHFLNSSLELGVKGLIPKTMPLQSLNSVIQLIMSGQIFVPMNDVINNSEQQSGTGSDLNEKELFVLRLAADGMTNKEIARDMSCTEVTVKMHMRSICKKLGARNRAHAAMISRELSII
jgi:two-component system nitrate/nitrite response regulator NarP